ncbi:MAG: hypothetical protein AAB566_02015 [Patescibacteria group bacterium]
MPVGDVKNPSEVFDSVAAIVAGKGIGFASASAPARQANQTLPTNVHNGPEQALWPGV